MFFFFLLSPLPSQGLSNMHSVNITLQPFHEITCTPKLSLSVISHAQHTLKPRKQLNVYFFWCVFSCAGALRHALGQHYVAIFLRDHLYHRRFIIQRGHEHTHHICSFFVLSSLPSQGLSDMHSVNITLQPFHEITCMRGWMEGSYRHSRDTVYPCQSAGNTKSSHIFISSLQAANRYINSKRILLLHSPIRKSHHRKKYGLCI